jgi:hypothetical protein
VAVDTAEVWMTGSLAAERESNRELAALIPASERHLSAPNLM